MAENMHRKKLSSWVDCLEFVEEKDTIIRDKTRQRMFGNAERQVWRSNRAITEDE